MSLGGKSDFILARQVQITARKIRGVLKRSPVGELDVAPLAADQPIGLEALEDAVDVNRREAGRISELLLGHRQFEPVLGSEPARFEANRELAQDMGDAGAGVAPPDVDHPFAQNRRLDQGRMDDGDADGRALQHQLLQRLARDVGNHRAGQDLDSMIADAQKHVLEVDRISGDAQGDDLTRSFASDLLTVGKTAQKDAAVGRLIALADEVAAGLELAQPPRQIEDCLTVIRGQRRIRSQVAKEQVERLVG